MRTNRLHNIERLEDRGGRQGRGDPTLDGQMGLAVIAVEHDAVVLFGEAVSRASIAGRQHILEGCSVVGVGHVRRVGAYSRLLALKAVVQHAQGDPEQALATLGQALELAEPEGYVRAFADEREPMARLLRRMLTRSPASEYARRILDALGERAPERAAAERPGAASLIEQLTEREVQVLRLIADGATNKEIADELVLTVNTVKRHISNIFGKLEVSNRTQAIARARQLNLL